MSGRVPACTNPVICSQVALLVGQRLASPRRSAPWWRARRNTRCGPCPTPPGGSRARVAERDRARLGGAPAVQRLAEVPDQLRRRRPGLRTSCRCSSCCRRASSRPGRWRRLPVVRSYSPRSSPGAGRARAPGLGAGDAGGGVRVRDAHLGLLRSRRRARPRPASRVRADSASSKDDGAFVIIRTGAPGSDRGATPCAPGRGRSRCRPRPRSRRRSR